jgi:hypothetical protein
MYQAMLDVPQPAFVVAVEEEPIEVAAPGTQIAESTGIGQMS